jgi:hypothetical protein
MEFVFLAWANLRDFHIVSVDVESNKQTTSSNAESVKNS